MVLRPIPAPGSSTASVPAWDAVLPTQHQRSSEYWLIAQPDHASLAGDIAARLDAAYFPRMDEAVLRGITLHDQGWAEFDRRALASSAPPRSFIDESPQTFVEAWTGSIEHSAAVAPIAGMIVSRHFVRLAIHRTKHINDDAADRKRLADFLSAEESRQRQLSSGCGGYDIEGLTDVLQFCDLLSLYLCSGAAEDVEFPQGFGGRTIRLQRIRTADEATICRFIPAIFGRGTELAVAARKWPLGGESREFLSILQ